MHPVHFPDRAGRLERVNELIICVSVACLSHSSLDWYRPAWVVVTSNKSRVMVVRKGERGVLTRLTAQFARPIRPSGIMHQDLIKRASARSASDTGILALNGWFEFA